MSMTPSELAAHLRSIATDLEAAAGMPDVDIHRICQQHADGLKDLLFTVRVRQAAGLPVLTPPPPPPRGDQ